MAYAIFELSGQKEYQLCYVGYSEAEYFCSINQTAMQQLGQFGSQRHRVGCWCGWAKINCDHIATE
jgi:hypothetical protein